MAETEKCSWLNTVQWFVHLNEPNPLEMWKDQPTFVLANILYLTMAVMTLKYALKRGSESRYLYLWIAALLHGVVTEIVSYNFPDINNFWHSQTPIMFAGQRFPLYIVLFYPSTLTYAFIAADKLRLPHWVQPFAVGLFDVLLDFPYDIMGIKLLWWTWHDTDMNISDRHYWVPWTSYFFHMSFHSTFAALLNYSRFFITGSANRKFVNGTFAQEFVCVVITAVFSMPLAILLQILPIYHGLKDGFGLHSEVIICLVFALYTSIVLWHDRSPKPEARREYFSWSGWFQNEVSLMITTFYAFYALLVYFARPENERSFGMHEPIGPSSEKMQLHATSGVIYTKQRYLDPTNYDEGYFDFRCTELGGVKGPPDPYNHKGDQWYTICGTPYDNHAEYIVVVWAFCALGFYAFYNALARSAGKAKYD